MSARRRNAACCHRRARRYPRIRDTKPLVSTDYKNDPRSTIVDAASTMVVMGNMVKIYAWYDNECGYSMRSKSCILITFNKTITT